MWTCARFVTRTFTAYLGMAPREPRKYLFGRYHFAAIGLSNRKQQFRFLFRRKGEAAFIILGKNRHRGPLLQGNTFQDDLSANDFSSCDFHLAEDTPIPMMPRHDAQRSR